MPPATLGRTAELSQLAAVLDAVPAGLCAVVVQGPPGIGKTTLWQDAVAAARQREYQVLTVSGAQAEAALPFAGLCDLLEYVLDDVLPELPEVQRHALEVALRRRSAEGAAIDQLAVSLAAAAVLRAASRKAPTVVAVDDLQWLDASTARAVVFALRRLGGEWLGVVGTVRSQQAGPLPFELDRAFAEGRLERLWLGPLPLGALDLLLRDRCQLGLPRPVLARLHQACDGNPFYALELARTLPTGATLDPGEVLGLPPSLTVLLRHRLTALPRGCDQVLLAAAALAQPTVALLGQIGDGLDEPLNAGVLVRDGERIGFSHPLLGSLVYADATPEQRRQTHRRLAELLGESEERALHLALGTQAPDEHVAATLEAAARTAASRGAPEVAAQLAEHAGRLTPPGRDADQVRRQLAAADHHEAAANGPRCRAILQPLASSLPAGPARAEVLYRLANVLTDIKQAVALAEQALAEAGGDVALRGTVHYQLGALRAMAGDWRGEEREMQAAAEAAEAAGDGLLLVRALAELGALGALFGRGLQRPLMARALALAPTVGGLRAYDSPERAFGAALTWADELDGARRLLHLAADRAAEQGDVHGQGGVLSHLADLELRAGNWQLADRYAAEAWELLRQADIGNEEPAALWCRALVDAHLGRIAAARAAAQQGSAASSAMGDEIWRVENECVLGFLALSLGDAQGAHAHLDPLVGALQRMGIGEPSVFPVLPNDAEALVALGRLDQAEELLDQLEARGRALDRAWALASAARGRALLAAARGNPKQALGHLEDALGEHQRLGYPFELARTLHAQGSILRRDKQKAAAKATLEQALGLFERLGASLWAESARAELGRVGLRPAGPAELTEAEAKVAELVAAGHTNRAIAGALFMSPRTVEAHLTRVYRKLGVRSRVELARLLSTVPARLRQRT
jgi:DNA-binding CsgD family transcriptional regulator